MPLISSRPDHPRPLNIPTLRTTCVSDCFFFFFPRRMWTATLAKLCLQLWASGGAAFSPFTEFHPITICHDWEAELLHKALKGSAKIAVRLSCQPLAQKSLSRRSPGSPWVLFWRRYAEIRKCEGKLGSVKGGGLCCSRFVHFCLEHYFSPTWAENTGFWNAWLPQDDR